jgi:magnesium chelatase family protein
LSENTPPGSEAAWAGDIEILAAPDLLALINHFKGTQLLSQPAARRLDQTRSYPDLIDIKA